MTSTTPKEFLPGVPDYSTVHEPLGELFTPIKSKEKWRSYMLTQEEINEYWEKGFLLNIPLLSPEDCDRILEDYNYFIGEKEHPGIDMMYEHHSNQGGDPNKVLMHGLGQWRLTKLFHDLVFLPQAIVKSSQLLKTGAICKTRLWIDQMFAKPAQHGGCVAWHQDYSYWTRTKPHQHVTIYIALEDQSEENGVIQYIPGSHRWTRNENEPLPVTDYNFRDMESIKTSKDVAGLFRRVLYATRGHLLLPGTWSQPDLIGTILTEEEKNAFNPVYANLKKGEATFHHGFTVHGSYGNKSNRPRRSTVLNYFADGTYCDTNEDLLKGVHINRGDNMDGQFFPLVFDPEWLY